MTVKQLQDTLDSIKDKNKIIKVWQDDNGYYGLIDIDEVNEGLTCVTISVK